MRDQLPGGVLATSRARPAVPAARIRQDSTLAVVGAATLLVMVAFTTVMTTLDQTARSFGASIGWQTWELSGMSLGLAGALLSAGALADVLGRRRVFILASLALAASSVLAALAASMLIFVVARVLQGAAGAGILAAGLGLIGHAFPPGRSRTQATGIWGAMLAGGIALGPIVGAGLAIVSDWRAAYGVEAVAALAVAGTATMLPESRQAHRSRRLDPPGALAIL